MPSPANVTRKQPSNTLVTISDVPLSPHSGSINIVIFYYNWHEDREESYLLSKEKAHMNPDTEKLRKKYMDNPQKE